MIQSFQIVTCIRALLTYSTANGDKQLSHSFGIIHHDGLYCSIQHFYLLRSLFFLILQHVLRDRERGTRFASPEFPVMNVNAFARETIGKGYIKSLATYNNLDQQNVVVRAEHLCVCMREMKRSFDVNFWQKMKHYWWNLHLTLLNLHRTHICISSWEQAFGFVFLYNTPSHKTYKCKQI